MTENAYFAPILAVFGPKILIFMGVSKSFGTNITENHLDNLFASFFGQALDQMGQKCRYLAQNASFGPNLAVLGPKSNFFFFKPDNGGEKDNSLPGRVSAHGLGGLDNSELYLRKLFRLDALVTGILRVLRILRKESKNVSHAPTDRR